MTTSELKEEAKKVEENEKTHMQWKKQFLNVFVFMFLTLFTLVRGSSRMPSIIGIEKCTVGDSISFLVFCTLCVGVSYYALQILKREQFLRQHYGKGLCKSDVNVCGKAVW